MADGAISPEQAQYDANLKGWSGDRSARVKADDRLLNEISSRQQSEAVSVNTATSALGVEAANKAVMQEAERSTRMAKIRESIAKMFRKPDKPTATQTPQPNPA